MKQITYLNKKIGIWGFGIVGQSALKFFTAQKADCTIFDKKKIAIPHPTYATLTALLYESEYIIPSPGIDLRPYADHRDKFLAEADIFAHYWKKPIIAITGSIGKTTVTTLLGQCLEAAGYRCALGGNIGTGMLDLIANQENYDYALLELSSFQLELCRSFAPDLALWTNFYPNHLDRHNNLEDYFDAKMNIFRFQKEHQRMLINESVWQKILDKNTLDRRILQARALVNVLSYSTDTSLPPITHPENWQMIINTFKLLGISLPTIANIAFKLPEHRLEYVAMHNGISFYNDSKATITQATLSAVNQLGSKPIILLLGGISKGVDRAPLISALRGKVRAIIAFGKEAEILKKLCVLEAIICTRHATLESAFHDACTMAESGDQILLSPGGASFDLFLNYQERGVYFKQLVHEHGQKIT
ncbi:MAG: UDP-N-acetylmuramoyl-L-alanine--D-glutamate ligase [Candidatus Babeliales bacterium]